MRHTVDFDVIHDTSSTKTNKQLDYFCHIILASKFICFLGGHRDRCLHDLCNTAGHHYNLL